MDKDAFHTFPSSQKGVPFVAKEDGVFFAHNSVAPPSIAAEILRLAAREKALTKALDELCEAVARGRNAVTPALERAHIELTQGLEG